MPRKLERQTLGDEHTGEPAEDAGECTLANLLEPGRVACNITARSKKHCLEIVSRLLTNDTDTLTYAEVFETIYQRERLGSTSLGEGFALPHGRVDDLDTSIGAFLMLTKPIDFDLDGESEVDMVFALAVPKDSTEAHLQDLSAIANLLSSTDVRGSVGDIRGSRDLYAALLKLSEQSRQQPEEPSA